ncbi:MAG: UDP-N-acetylglucosamine--N-acetylmuramyl-(pentapeptide) pyrophosphoryl-undecaprenol N-acetylglucosamine transferase, partial [Planctomycetes bacterium]|nr:UDP-N-acetylglucosamine--N-acetylmuramyl-(pentapeptide) pyrophosphoryl-undecaprenol N-acetylglucosamine transferase [Planctomycetota bacterium]
RPDANIQIEHVALPAEPLSQLRRRPFRFLWNNARATWQTLRQFRRDRPAAVIGLGSFASAPVILGARRLRIPIVLLEQNVIPGRVTRWIGRLAQTVCISFSETQPLLPSGCRAVVTGNPVRCSVRNAADRLKSVRPESGITLMVLGGSQGAAALNAAVPKALQAIRDQVPELRVVHQAGAGQEESVQRAYGAMGIAAIVRPFFADLPDWMARADLAVSRAGATTLAELACLRVPAILVPYPYAADDHQLRNARFFELGGAAGLVCQSGNDHWLGVLAESLARLLTDPLQRHRMARAMARLAQPDAADRVAEQVARLIGHAPHADFPRVPHRLRAARPERATAASLDRSAD